MDRSSFSSSPNSPVALHSPALERAQLILATHNEHKVKELKAILGSLLADFDPDTLIGARELGLPEPVEDGTTFTANALIKARAIAQATGKIAIADDSGICVDIMGGAPGIFSARWSGQHGQDHANLELLLAQLSDVPEKNRAAAFVCAAVVVTPGGIERSTIGKMPGRIALEASGEGGFGYDPIFIPEGYEVSVAEISDEEKNSISHRGQAFKALAPVIATLLELGSDVTPEQARP